MRLQWGPRILCTINRSFKWPSMQKWLTSVLLKALFNQVGIRYPCFFFFQHIFTCGFSSKVTCTFFLIRNNGEIFRIDTFSVKKKQRYLAHVFYQIKDLRLPLWTGHYHLCMEGHLKLRLQSLKNILFSKTYWNQYY